MQLLATETVLKQAEMIASELAGMGNTKGQGFRTQKMRKSKGSNLRM